LKNNLCRGPGFGALLLSLPALAFILSLLWQIVPAPAQVETFTYQGPAFDVAYCNMVIGAPGYCRNGSVTGTATIYGYPSNFTGSITLGAGGRVIGQISALGRSLDSASISCMTGGVTLSAGEITSGGFSGESVCSGPPYPFYRIETGGAPGGDDTYVVNGSGGLDEAGYIGPTAVSYWTGPKAIGIACNQSGGCATGEPINLGNGNVFDQVTDYETAGQNKLSLIRYYNSMAWPATSATSMGGYWRTNYDRYLHIINPSAIYGVLAERPDGQVISFSSSSGTYTPDSDVDVKLTVSGSTWTLTDHDDTVETYTQSGSLATLNSIKKRGGYLQAIGYSSGQISYVSDSYSRQLGFSYSSAGLLTGVTTPDSLTLSYGYMSFTSTGTQLTSVSYNTSPTTKQTYLYENASYPSALTGITDENGNRYATWGYDGLGRGILSELSGAVNYTSVYYNDSNGNRVVKGPLGLVETYKFSTLQGVPKVTEIDRAANGTVKAATETFGYDSNGYLRSKNDWNGNNTTWVNNSHGLPTQITYASATTNAQTTNITYDLSWPHLPHTIATNGLNSNFTYDSSGNMLTQKLTDETSQSVPYSTNGTTRTWTYTYNRTGQLLTARLPRTDVTAKTTYTYAGGTSGGTLISIKDAVGNTTTVTQATGGGYPKKTRDPNSVFTTLSWTPRLWLSSSVISTSAGTLTTSWTYDSAGNLTKNTLGDGSYLSYGYDNAHRPTSITNALSESQGITYDSAGDVTQILWKNASSVTKRQHTATYDALGRMLTDVGGVSQTTSYTYDKNGNVLTITDPLSNVRYISSDQLNRPYRYKDALNYLSSIKYDSHNRPLTFTDPKGNATTWVYDGFGDTIQRNNPDTLKTIFWYDPDSNLTGKNETGIHFSSATYDADDRQLTRTYTGDSSLNVSFTYDQNGHFKGVGHLTSVTADQVGSQSLSWDERGHILSQATTIAGQVYTNTYTYESAGRLSSVKYASSGWKAAYTRDSAGQITAVTDTQPGHSAVNLATSVTHMPFGPLASLTWGNGVTDARTFDLDYRMTSITDHGTANIQYLSYGYDADNNVHTITDNVTPANSITLTYDAINRLIQAGGSITYDSNSNILTVGSVTNTVPANNDLMSASNGGYLLYDSAGNMTSVNGGAIQTYSKANRLATVNTTTSYKYDAFGTRQVVKNGTTPFQVMQYDLNGNLLTETSAAATPVETDYVYLDNMPLSAIQPAAATISALHTDRIGTVEAATNSSKTVVWLCAYAPFGACAPSPASITMNLRFPGQYADPTGFYHNGFRDTFPGSNNNFYLQPDFIGLTGPANPWSNPVIYAGMNPYKYTDPSGLCIEDACIGEFLALEFLGESIVEGSELLGEALAQGEELEAEGAAAKAVIPPPTIAEPFEPAPQAGVQCTAPNPLENANFAQRNFSTNFSNAGLFSGQSVEDVAAAIRSGQLSPQDVPVQYIVRDGNTLILNTRSAQALEQAGIPRSLWSATNETGNPAAEYRLDMQLQRSGLGSQGSPTVTPRGN
jgi:RHS repeat-associated protein